MNEAEIADDIRGHDERNAVLITRFAERGVGLEDEINAEFHFYAPNKAQAAMLAKELFLLDHLVLLLRPAVDGSGEWSIESGTRQRLADVVSSETSRQMVGVAARFQARYDGWGATVPKKS